MRTEAKPSTASPVRIPAARLLSIVALLVAPGMNQVRADVQIRMDGCDRMIQLMAAWAEAYHQLKPHVFVNLSGSGPSGDHFAALQHNSKDIIGACHQITPEWRAKITAATAESAK